MMNTSQTRYRTLVSHLTKVYAAEESARTTVLQEGLDDIVTKIAPSAATAWGSVKVDSQRLLTVWKARESRPGTEELAEQILDSLDEFASGAPSSASVPEVEAMASVPEVEAMASVPKVEPVPVPEVVACAPVPEVEAPAPTPTPVIELIPARIEIQEIVLEGTRVDLTPFVPATIVAPVLSTAQDEEGEADEDAEEMSVPSQDSQEGEAEEEDTSASTTEEVEVEEEAEEEEVVEEEVEEEAEEEVVEEEVEEEVVEEVVEPEEEEVEEEAEEEEGMEVEKKIFRGRAYWLDIKTNKLYSVVGDDDVGDEVGKVVDGRPVFLAVTAK